MPLYCCHRRCRSSPLRVRSITWRRFEPSSSPSSEDSPHPDFSVNEQTDNLPKKRGFSIVAAVLKTAELRHFRLGDGIFLQSFVLRLFGIVHRVLFEAVRQKSLAQWSHRTVLRNKSDHLLAGLLFDDAGHRMIPTYATKAGMRYRYYVSTPVLHGQAKTASAGSVCRVPAADIEEAVVKFLKDHLAAEHGKSPTVALSLGDRGDLAQMVSGIVVHRDKLIVRLNSDEADEASASHNQSNRPPKDPARSCSRIMHLEAKSDRNSSSGAHAW